IWNGMAVIGWIWALPFARLNRSRVAFIGVWVLPGMLFQALVHVEEAGHTIFSIPAWCVLGGVVLAVVAKRFTAAAVVAVMVLNVALFLNYVPLPPVFYSVTE